MSPLRSALVGLVLALAGTLAVAAPASAHDELLGSTPAADARLDTAPAEVVLTYSAAILPEGAAVAVLDEDGTDWAAGGPVIETNTLTVALGSPDAMRDAGYVIEWRVVSSDGHPISGTIPFTIGAGEPVPDGAIPGADAEARDPGRGAAGLALTLTAVGFAGVVLALVLILVVARRRRRVRAAD